MDGTLVDSVPYWTKLTPDYLADRGLKVRDGFLERIRPMIMAESCAALQEEYSLPESPEEIRKELNAQMHRHYLSDVPLKDGAKQALDALRDAGAKMCIVTSTTPPLVHACLQRLGIEEYFEFIMSCEETGRGKEYPDSYLEAARRLGAAPAQVAVFEDSEIALRTAKDAGFTGIIVYDPANEKWEESIALADDVITDWGAWSLAAT